MKGTRLFANIQERLSGIRFALDAVPTATAITDDETELLAEVETLLGVAQRLARRVGGLDSDRRSITQQTRYVGENLVCRACGRSGDALLSPCNHLGRWGRHDIYVRTAKGEDDEQDP